MDRKFECNITEKGDVIEIEIDRMYFGDFLQSLLSRFNDRIVVDLGKGKLNYIHVNKFSDHFLNGFFYDIEKTKFDKGKASFKASNISYLVKKLVKFFDVLDFTLISDNISIGVTHDEIIMIKIEEGNENKIKQILSEISTF